LLYPQINTPRPNGRGLLSYPSPVDILEGMRRSAARDAALHRPPETPVHQLPSPVLVRVRAIHGRAIATTAGHVLHEWVRYGAYHVRWDPKWQVVPVSADEWDGEQID
jgi:hypothetical protein